MSEDDPFHGERCGEKDSCETIQLFKWDIIGLWTCWGGAVGGKVTESMSILMTEPIDFDHEIREVDHDSQAFDRRS